MSWLVYMQGLPVVLVMGFVTWVYSAFKKNVNIVDSLWSLMFLVPACFYASRLDVMGSNRLILLAMVTLWAVRLATHLWIRNRGEPEDRRYAGIRENNQPDFTFKSLYLVFGLQAVLAWVIGVTLFSALRQPAGFTTWHLAGLFLWVSGFVMESTADWQLYRFKSQPENAGRVLDTGLWHYTRHPNYFGEFLIWWGFYCFTLPSGALAGLVGPLIMSFLLMKFSGVPMLEKDITRRRGAYGEYIRRTNAFFPWSPAQPASDTSGQPGQG